MTQSSSSSRGLPLLGKEVSSKPIRRFSARKSNNEPNETDNESNDLMKLDFSAVSLVGREKELEIMENAFNSCLNEKGTRVVFVDGDSGMGKTTLVDHFVKQCLPKNAYVATGKFTEHEAKEPHSALKSVLSQLMSKVRDPSGEKGELARNSRKSIFSTLLPIIIQFVNQNIYQIEDDGDLKKSGAMENFNRLKFVISSFVGCICSSEQPIVLWLDDLHWADSSALDLVEAVVKSTETNNLLLIGGYRGKEIERHTLFRGNNRRISEEVSLTHLLTTDSQTKHRSSLFFRNKKGKKSTGKMSARFSSNSLTPSVKLPFKFQQLGSEFLRIQLSDLDLDGVNKIVSKLTNYDYDPERTKPLANIVFRRTHGNVFFVFQFISMLREEGLLYYSFGTYRWEWEDIEKIEQNTSLTDNVVDVVAKNIQRLPEYAKPVIQIAACFRSSFSPSVLGEVLQNLNLEDDENDESQIAAANDNMWRGLEAAVEAGIIERRSSKDNIYKFSHDRIMSVAYTCLSDEQERAQLHLRIGDLLKQTHVSGEQEEEWKLFVSTNQLNLGSTQIVDSAEKKELAKMNLRAGEKAMSCSAFVLAAKYIDYGIALLDKHNNWENDYDLSLDLYSAAVEMAFCNGNFEEYEHLAEEVLLKGRCFRDKLRVYTACVDMLGSRKRHKEAVTLGFQILSDLGEKFPKRPNLIHIVVHLVKTKSMLRDMTDEDLMELPKMDNADKVAAMKMLKSITTHVYVLHKMEYFALILFRMMQVSLEHGVSNVSPLGFASYGVMLRGIAGDIKGGHRFGKLGLELVHRLNAKETEAQVLMVTNIFLNHWQKPLHDSIEPLLHGHKVGMECGDIEYALYCANIYLQLYFYTGLPLQPYESDLNDFCLKMAEYNQEATLHVTLPYWQCALNLMGRSEKPTELTGEVMEQTEYLETSEESHDERAKQIVLSLRLQLGYYFGDLELAETMAQKLWKDFERKEEDTSLTSYGLTFYSALVSLEITRHRQRRKHRAHARKCIKKMKKYVDAGAVNFVHKLLLLRAEYSSLSRCTSDEVKTMYEAAISAASRSGFLQDCALANERAGVYFGDIGDHFWASEYLTRAHELYGEYGAKAKADHLVSTYPGAFSDLDKAKKPSQVGSNLKGRRRFNKEVFDMLQSDPSKRDATRLAQSEPFQLELTKIG